MQGLLVSTRAYALLRDASVPQRLGVAGFLVYASVFGLLLAFGRPGLGIGQGFYLAIVLVALASGPAVGTAAGVLAALLYVAAQLLSARESWTRLPGPPIEVRLAAYVVAGAAVGYFARRGRRLLAESLHLLDDLLRLSHRDLETGALDPHGLETAIARRAERRWPFALLVGAIAPAREGTSASRPDDVLRDVMRKTATRLPVDSELARVGPSQFAVVASCLTLVDARDLAAELERDLAADGRGVTFGWSLHPQEGADTLTLFRSASERLYARRLVRGEWRPTAATAELVAEIRPGLA